MDRRVVLAAGTAVVAVGAFGLASPALGLGRDAPRGPLARAGAARPLPSVTLIGDTTSDFPEPEYDVLYSLEDGDPVFSIAAPTSALVNGVAVSPGGTAGLIANGKPSVVVIYTFGNRSGEFVGEDPPVELGQFRGENTTTGGPTSTGVAMNGSAGLVALGEPGVVQLRHRPSGWPVDSRVHSAGRDQNGKTHRPGFIALPAGHGSSRAAYDGVVLSRVPTPRGATLAVAIARRSKLLAVISGVGSAHPTVVGHLTDPDLAPIGGDAVDASGGVAFSPVTSTRAVVLTTRGLDVLDLSDPHHPRLIRRTRLPGVGDPEEDGRPSVSVAVSPDGNHVAIDKGATVVVASGLLGHSGPLKKQAQVAPASSTNQASLLDSIDGGAFLANGEYLLHRSEDELDQYAGELTRITGIEHGRATVGASIPLAGQGRLDTVATSAGPVPVSIKPIGLRTLRVGHLAGFALRVAHGVGHYRFSVVHGQLPAGLVIRGNVIVGTPKHAGRGSLRLRALNQYGGAAFATVAVKVAPRRS